jgi:Ca-activated chloride channel family protein
VIIASSSEKSGMLGDFASSYNRAGPSVGDACVRVKSGDAERALETGWGWRPSETPDVWSLASRAWVVLLAQRSASGAALLPAGYDSLFQSPLVLGMREPMAAALGYPGKRHPATG